MLGTPYRSTRPLHNPPLALSQDVCFPEGPSWTGCRSNRRWRQCRPYIDVGPTPLLPGSEIATSPCSPAALAIWRTRGTAIQVSSRLGILMVVEGDQAGRRVSVDRCRGSKGVSLLQAVSSGRRGHQPSHCNAGEADQSPSVGLFLIARLAVPSAWGDSSSDRQPRLSRALSRSLALEPVYWLLLNIHSKEMGAECLTPCHLPREPEQQAKN